MEVSKMSYTVGTLELGLVGMLVLCILTSGIDPAFCEEAGSAVSPAIQELFTEVGKARTVEVDAIISGFIEENRDEFPLIEDSLVTFVYYGRVAVRANVPSDLNRWDTKADQMQRLGMTDLHYLTLKLPLDARIDYKFYVDGLWMLDALNSKTVRGGFGDNSAFAMPGYVPPGEIEFVDTVPHGRIEAHEFKSKIILGSREIQVYLPHEYRPLRVREQVAVDDGIGTMTTRDEFAGTYPVIFVQDGGEYITLASMVNVLDNIIDNGWVPPVVAVFIDPVDRNYEYFLNKDYERMMIEEILPFIRDRYDVSIEPGKTAIMGASLGGAISVMIAMDHPETFGKCGSQSGAFEINDRELIKRVQSEPKRPVDFYLDCGTFGDLLEENRAMRDALEKKEYGIGYQEFNEGHSWGNWRAHIDDMLVFFWGKGGK
jgi:enterochelin esterase-like enzyme